MPARTTDPATRWQRVAQASRAARRSAGRIGCTHGTALWHRPGKPMVPILWVLVRHPDGRREPYAFLRTDTDADPRGVLNLFDRRWSVETAYEEARAHLAPETRRRWSDPAVFRATPLLLGLHSAVALHMHQNAERLALSPRRAARYPKPAATSADALARSRRHLWSERLVLSAGEGGMTEPVPPDLRRLVEVACHAPWSGTRPARQPHATAQSRGALPCPDPYPAQMPRRTDDPSQPTRTGSPATTSLMKAAFAFV